MPKDYDFRTIEASAHADWNKNDVYRVVEGAKTADGKLKPKFYACSMLPYISMDVRNDRSEKREKLF